MTTAEPKLPANFPSLNPVNVGKDSARMEDSASAHRQSGVMATTFALRVCCTLQFYVARTPMLD